ncbi:MAG: HEAT repeat domain-containing protein [Phycisphaeraceae bacterium]
MRWGTCTLLVSATLLAGCAPPASQGGFDSDNPAAKLYAIRRAGRPGNAADIPKLVEQLDHDDPAVRLMAIKALDEITGTRLGYNPYDSSAQRRTAIERWQEAVRSEQFDASGQFIAADERG